MSDRDWDESGDRTAQAEIKRLREDNKRLRAKIEAALDATETWDGYCMECSTKEWPCPTVKALRGETK